MFLLTLDKQQHLARIHRRARARAIDEINFELDTVARERAALAGFAPPALGIPFEVGDGPEKLAQRLLPIISG